MVESSLKRKPGAVRNRTWNFDPSGNTKVFGREGKDTWLIQVGVFCLCFLKTGSLEFSAYSLVPLAELQWGIWSLTPVRSVLLLLPCSCPLNFSLHLQIDFYNPVAPKQHQHDDLDTSAEVKGSLWSLELCFSSYSSLSVLLKCLKMNWSNRKHKL